MPPGGRLQRVVTVTADAPQGQDPSLAGQYTCYVVLRQRGNARFYNPERPNTPDNLKPRQGSRPTLRVAGRF